MLLVDGFLARVQKDREIFPILNFFTKVILICSLKWVKKCNDLFLNFAHMQITLQTLIESETLQE